MQRILVGVDGSEPSLDALSWSADLAMRRHVDLIAARTFSPTDVESIFGDDAKLHEQQWRELDEWCRALPAGVPVPKTFLLDGDPADVLPRAAVEHQADLLVVGERDREGPAHPRFASIAHHLLRHLSLPLAVVTAAGAGTIRHVVVGVDGSPGSDAAVAFCADLVAGLDVTVTAVHADEPLLEWVPRSADAGWHEAARAKVTEWAQPIRATGVDLQVLVERDIHPVAALARAAVLEAGTLVVVGSRGAGGFSGLRVGRVPLQLLQQTGAALIVVPRSTSRA